MIAATLRHLTKALPGRLGVHAEDAFVTNRDILHFHLRLSNAKSTSLSARIVLRKSVNGKRILETPVTFDSGEATAVIPMNRPELRTPGILTVHVTSGLRDERVRFAIAKRSRSAIIRSHFSAHDGIRINPTADKNGLLILEAKRRFTAHVSEVDAGVGSIGVAITAILRGDETPHSVVLTERNTDNQLHTAITGRHSVLLPDGARRWTLTWDVPMPRLAESIRQDTADFQKVWDLDLETDKRTYSMAHKLGDIRSPRDVRRYLTVTEIDAPLRDRFRPYWTKDTRLAIEHLRGLPNQDGKKNK